jgi:hypothetical protein
MRYLVVLLATVMMGFFIGCSKSSPSIKGGNSGDSTNSGNTGTGGNTGGKSTGSLPFANYEYQGFMTELTREWQKPILIHFNADSTVVDYCTFMLNGNTFTQDSITGKITQIAIASGGGPSLTIYFKEIADTQVYNFSADYSGLSGGSNGLAANQFTFQGLTKDTHVATTLGNSYWTSDTSTENNTTLGSPWYPDINGVQFVSNGTSDYDRNGLPATVGLIPSDTLVFFKYFQYGNRVYFYGYNETIPAGIPYWGIISDDGNTINADTRDFTSARVPNYLQNFDYYGEPGNPPVMHKKLLP